ILPPRRPPGKQAFYDKIVRRNDTVLRGAPLARGENHHQDRAMLEVLETGSLPTAGLLVLGFFGGLTALSVLVGFGVERALPGKRIFSVPLAEGQYRFEIVGNVVFVTVSTV